MNEKQIIAIGGGGFGRNPNQSKIEEYILNSVNSSKPNVCFIPTASAEDKAYTVNFYSVFSKFDTKLTHINFFQRTPRLDSIINKQDIIFVGGGNTKSMLAVWKEWKLDKLLLKAYNRGTVLCGVSAGAICWFTEGITDSWASNLNVMDCMDFVSGCCCPHYDGEKDRRPSVHSLIENNQIEICYAIEDGSALHFKDGKIFQNVDFMNGKNSYIVSKEDSIISEKKINSVTL